MSAAEAIGVRLDITSSKTLADTLDLAVKPEGALRHPRYSNLVTVFYSPRLRDFLFSTPMLCNLLIFFSFLFFSFLYYSPLFSFVSESFHFRSVSFREISSQLTFSFLLFYFFIISCDRSILQQAATHHVHSVHDARWVLLLRRNRQEPGTHAHTHTLLSRLISSHPIPFSISLSLSSSLSLSPPSLSLSSSLPLSLSSLPLSPPSLSLLHCSGITTA